MAHWDNLKMMGMRVGVGTTDNCSGGGSEGKEKYWSPHWAPPTSHFAELNLRLRKTLRRSLKPLSLSSHKREQGNQDSRHASWEVLPAPALEELPPSWTAGGEAALEYSIYRLPWVCIRRHGVVSRVYCIVGGWRWGQYFNKEAAFRVRNTCFQPQLYHLLFKNIFHLAMPSPSCGMGLGRSWILVVACGI